MSEEKSPNDAVIYYAEGVEKTEASEAVVEEIINNLKRVYDPEIPVDIYELGLIYVIEFLDTTEDHFKIKIDMTLTAPGCPVQR